MSASDERGQFLLKILYLFSYLPNSRPVQREWKLLIYLLGYKGTLPGGGGERLSASRDPVGGAGGDTSGHCRPSSE